MEQISFTNLIVLALQKINPYLGNLADLFLLVCLVLVVFVIYQRGNRFAYMVPTVLTMLGITGAILGVFVGLSAFDVNHIQQSLPVLLNGLRIAILISVVTLFSAVLVRTINNTRRLMAQEQGVISGVTPAMIYQVLKEISNHQIDQKGILSSMAEQANENQQGLQKVLESQKNDFVQQLRLLKDINRSLVGAEESSLVSQMQKLHTHLEGEYSVQKRSAKGFEDFTEEFRTWSARLAENNLPSLIQTLRDSNHSGNEQFNEDLKQLTFATNTLITWQTHYHDQITRLNDQFAYSLDGISKTRDALQDIATHTQSIPHTMGQLGQLMQGLQQQMADMELYLESFQHLRTQAGQALPLIENNLNQLVQGMQQEMQHNLDLMEISLETQLDMAETSLENQMESFQVLQEGFATLVTQVRTVTGVQNRVAEIQEVKNSEVQETLSPDLQTFAEPTFDVQEFRVPTDHSIPPPEVERDLDTPVTQWSYDQGKVALVELNEIQHTEEALTQTDDDWQTQGYHFMQAGHYHEAITCFDKAIELKPTEFALFYNKACCQALQGRADLALMALQQATFLNPECLDMARNDNDFDYVRHDAKFQGFLNHLY